MNRLPLFIIFFLCFSKNIVASNPPATEIRAVWLTTHLGLDWPKSDTNAEVQKRELIGILDNLQKNNFNTVIFQVRTRGEVLYKSNIEPMSSLIKGSGNFDPLAFAIAETHKRGMECHAWFVTYPLGSNKHVNSLGAKSVVKKRPSITKKYKNDWYLDPGNPNTDEYLLSLVKEIVSNYDIDGIHFDYIRYPDNNGKFPDAATHRLYGKGKFLNDWRRDNITRFVTKVYDWVKSKKPWVQVSSAPLGRYRAINGKGGGWTAFETVYQDVGKWMKTGKQDAIFPMMYYKEGLFYPFVDDWVANANNRIVVPGLGAYQMIELGWSKNDIVNQIDYTREKNVYGQAFFRTENILSNTKGILNSLKEYYKYPAKLPPLTWICDTIPARPIDLTAEKLPNGKLSLKWENGKNQKRVTYNVYRSLTEDFDVNKAENLLAVGLKEPKFEYSDYEMETAYYYYVTVSDSYHNESDISAPAFFYHSETIK